MKAPVQSHVYLGYDGIDKSKSLLVPKGAAAQISVKLVEEYLSFLGFRENQYEMAFTLSQEEIKNCEDECTTTFCKNYTLKFIEKIQDHMVRESVKLKDVLEIRPVISCFDDEEATVGAWKWKLELKDTGDDSALGLVQAQVPANSIVARTDRDAATSTYEIITTTSGTPTAFNEYKKALFPITVLNSLNQSGIKQIEKDLIKKIIENYLDNKNKNINFTEKLENNESNTRSSGDRRRWDSSRGNQTLDGSPINTKRKNVTGADPELTYLFYLI